MKYIVVIFQNNETTASFVYSEKSGAMAKFHYEMEYANNANITTLCMVVNSNGAILANEKYTSHESGEE